MVHWCKGRIFKYCENFRYCIDSSNLHQLLTDTFKRITSIEIVDVCRGAGGGEAGAGVQGQDPADGAQHHPADHSGGAGEGSCDWCRLEKSNIL